MPVEKKPVTAPPETILVKDPCLTGGRASPYEWVARRVAERGGPRLDPASPARVVQDALYYLNGREEREVLDEIRYPERRLCVDFFLYQFAAATSDDFLRLLDAVRVPVPPPDPRPWLELPLDGAAAAALPPHVHSGSTLEPVPLAGRMRPLLPLNLGPIDYDESGIPEERDVR